MVCSQLVCDLLRVALLLGNQTDIDESGNVQLDSLRWTIWPRTKGEMTEHPGLFALSARGERSLSPLLFLFKGLTLRPDSSLCMPLARGLGISPKANILIQPVPTINKTQFEIQIIINSWRVQARSRNQI